MSALVTWLSVGITVVLVHPVPYHSRVPHSTVPDPVCRVSIFPFPQNTSRGVVSGAVGRGEKRFVVWSRRHHPRHPVVERLPPRILPIIKLLLQSHLFLTVVCSNKTLNEENFIMNHFYIVTGNLWLPREHIKLIYQIPSLNVNLINSFFSMFLCSNRT